MYTKRKLLLVFRNPLIVVPPFVVILGLGWQHYTYAGRNLSLPIQSFNLLPNSDFAQFDSDSVPTGWEVTKSGTLHYDSRQTKGYAGGNSFELIVDHYQGGDVAATSPKLAVQAGKTYLFKGYYTASAPFALLTRYYYTDGSSVLNFVQTYPGASGTWSTASDAFKAAPNITAVQFVYRLYSNGRLQLNDPYFEPKQDVYITAPATGKNTIPNDTLQAAAYNVPQGWSTYHTGSNVAVFSYGQDTLGAYVQTQVSDYHNGETKWQYPAQAVQGSQYYEFSVDYQSDVPVPIVAEYVLQDGQRQDQTIATVQPADSWTTVSVQFEAPPEAATMFVSLPLQHDGTLATRQYALIDITKPGAPRWEHPVVSITFDDGWQLSYQNALPILQQYDYAATFYINPAAIETPNFMTATELTTLSNGGNEIGAHGYDHDDMTAINDSELDYQLHEGRDYLDTAGFQVTDFATPYGRSDAEVQWYARKYFTTLRGTETGINTRQNLDPYNLKVLYIDNFTTAKTLAAALQQAKAYDGWLILVYHRVGSGTPSYRSLNVESSTTTTTAVRQQIELIHKSGITVLPVAAAYEALQR